MKWLRFAIILYILVALGDNLLTYRCVILERRFYRLLLWLSRNDPPLRRARILRIASKYWVIVFVVAVVRFLPVVHNLLLLCFGYESPLSVMIFELGKYMGVAP